MITYLTDDTSALHTAQEVGLVLVETEELTAEGPVTTMAGLLRC